MSQFNQHAGGFVRHYDEITCLQYLEGLLDRPTARELSAHTDQCTDCRELDARAGTRIAFAQQRSS